MRTTRVPSRARAMKTSRVVAAIASVVLSLILAGLVGQAQSNDPVFDIVLRNGTILDGSGGPPYKADVGISGGFITAIGNLASARAQVDLSAGGLFVVPGFINIHSHAVPAGLLRAENMLTQGVTTEIINPDGFGTANIKTQLSGLAASGLAVNVGAYIGFNAVWQDVIGTTDRRPTQDDINRMRVLVNQGLEDGAWGVSAGLDYVPARFATTDEVVRVVEVARAWRTNFPNHDRVTAEANFSSRAGISETLAIARAAGLSPTLTHVKVTGQELGTAKDVLAMMATATTSGFYAAADVYPYIAGQTRLHALLIPGWAQDGGRAAMIARFADPALRARIVAETEQTLTGRLGGPDAVYLPATRQQLVDIMRAQNISAGEAIVRTTEQGEVSAVLRFGVERDVIAFLQHPTISVACDCGATASPFVHPRFYGTFPRVLGRYVREQNVLTWEDAVRKMTALPAATIGMVDRGLLAVGMAADVTVFDPSRIIDHATYEAPVQLSEGVRHVIVNGRMALRDGQVTGERAGRILTRTAHMPTRPMSLDGSRRVLAKTSMVEIDVTQGVTDRRGAGIVRIRDAEKSLSVEATELGVVQVTDRWATFSGRARVSSSGPELPFRVIVDQANPRLPGASVLSVSVAGADDIAIRLDPSTTAITSPAGR